MWWKWWCRWWPVGDDGGSHEGWWLGGEEAQKEPKPDVEEEEAAGGEHAMDACEGGPLPPPHSEARSLENMVMASGKLGGVAGVFLGVHICERKRSNQSAVRKSQRECFLTFYIITPGSSLPQPQHVFYPSTLKEQKAPSLLSAVRPVPSSSSHTVLVLYFSTATENRFCNIQSVMRFNGSVTPPPD